MACALLWLGVLILLSGRPARALEAIVIGPEQDRIDITLLGELYEGRGERLSVETAPSPDGIAGRMSVAAKTSGTNPNWVVFALSNTSDKSVTRWLTAQRYDISGSKIVWPDLDAPRIANVTPSLGFRPERVENEQADIYRLSIEPGATVTFIVELSSVGFPKLYLTTPAAFSKKQRDLTLYNGILLGIAGLLAIFLTAIFAANHKVIFPATALIAWSIVAYLCVDFGFWHKLFQLQAEDNAIYRAAAEAAVAASILVFLYSFLKLRLWHKWLSLLFLPWMAGQLGLIGFAVIDAQLAAGLARISFIPVALVGTALIAFLALRGQERALSLLPTWMLFLVWLFGAGVTVAGKLSGDVAASALAGGLILFIVLLGFTVTQYAFHAGDPVYGEDAGQFQLRVLALEASGASVWEWNTRRNEIIVGPEIDTALGYAPGTLRCGVEDWLQYLHTSDRERLRLILWSIRERHGGEINADFRLRRADGSYLWHELRAASAPVRHGRTLRCVGLLRDVTAQKRSQERLMHNAIHDSLTGLPNRELFLDRLHCALRRGSEEGKKPTVLFIDIDTFKGVSRSADLVVSDAMLLTIARRLSRHLGAEDTLARMGGEQFAILLSSETEPRHIAMLAERLRRLLRSPMKIGGKDIVLAGSIGIAVHDGHNMTHEELLRQAETAMYRAKRSGADRIELYKPDMRGESDDRAALERDLRQAIEKRQIRILYQPIIRLGDEQVAGMEALIRWEHPKLGRLTLPEFLPLAEASGLMGELGAYVFERAIRQVARWHRTLPRAEDQLFVSINLSSHQLFKQDFIQNLRLIIGREAVPKSCLRLEVTEALVMENPEQAIEILDWLKSLGAGLSLDDFGASYSSLSYLHRLPFDTIKLDRSLVSYSESNQSAAVVLRAVLAMARELGKDVVAVGVERQEDVAYVKALGCDYAQGFYFGEPMTEKEVVNLLSAMSRSSKREERRKDRQKPASAAPKPLESKPLEPRLFDKEGRTNGSSAPDAPGGEARPPENGGAKAQDGTGSGLIAALAGAAGNGEATPGALFPLTPQDNSGHHRQDVGVPSLFASAAPKSVLAGKQPQPRPQAGQASLLSLQERLLGLNKNPDSGQPSVQGPELDTGALSTPLKRSALQGLANRRRQD